jgi:hypothetical protein
MSLCTHILSECIVNKHYFALSANSISDSVSTWSRQKFINNSKTSTRCSPNDERRKSGEKTQTKIEWREICDETDAVFNNDEDVGIEREEGGVLVGNFERKNLF